MEKYFKVKIGYGKTEFLSVPESDLQSAIRAQVTGKVFISSETGETVRGNDIIYITADWNRHLGFNPEYQMVGEDFDLIRSDERADYAKSLVGAKLAVTAPVQHTLHD